MANDIPSEPKVPETPDEFRKEIQININRIRTSINNFDYSAIPAIDEASLARQLRLFPKEEQYFKDSNKEHFVRSIINIISMIINRLEQFLTDNPDLDLETLKDLYAGINSATFDFLTYPTYKASREAGGVGLQDNQRLKIDSIRVAVLSFNFQEMLVQIGLPENTGVEGLREFIINSIYKAPSTEDEFVDNYQLFKKFLDQNGGVVDPIRAGMIIAEYIAAFQLVSGVATKDLTKDLLPNIFYTFTHFYIGLEIGMYISEARDSAVDNES